MSLSILLTFEHFCDTFSNVKPSKTIDFSSPEPQIHRISLDFLVRTSLSKSSAAAMLTPGSRQGLPDTAWPAQTTDPENHAETARRDLEAPGGSPELQSAASTSPRHQRAPNRPATPLVSTQNHPQRCHKHPREPRRP